MVLAISPGMVSDREKIRAIVQIVASSVPGLDPKNVAITDQYGHYLSSALDQDSIINAEQLNYQNNVQNYYEKRIESMILPLIGDNTINVRVYANIDFSQQEEAKEQYDPNQQVIRSEQSVTQQEGAGAGASGAPDHFLTHHLLPMLKRKRKAANLRRKWSIQNESIKNYEVGNLSLIKNSMLEN